MAYARARTRFSWWWLGVLGAASCSEAPDTGPAVAGTSGASGAHSGESSGAGSNTAGKPSGSGASGGSSAVAGATAQGGTATQSGATQEGGAPTGGGVESSAGGMESFAGAGDALGNMAGEGGGADVAGSAGSSGGPPQPTAAEACVTCGNSECSALLSSCGTNPECAPWLACLKGCTDVACGKQCDATYVDAARVYRAVSACLCTKCADTCKAVNSCQYQCIDDSKLPPIATAPQTLAETGLYAADGRALSRYVRTYEPSYPLWADGAGKDRYVFIPPCSSIDTSDMNHWQFPVGTRFWKHFALDGKRLETRFLHRYGPGNGDWLYATYGWDTSKPEDASAAVIVLHGQPNAGGTIHDIPDPSACPSCHFKLPDKALGFGAIQLSHAGDGLTMQKLSDLGWLTVPARQGFPIPGTPVQRAALGYLHGNCGGCHNADGGIPRENPMRLRALVEETTYAERDAIKTTFGVPTINAYPELHDKPRIDPGSPSTSAVFLRMSDRNKFPMPPLATKLPDTDGGVAAVQAWIASLAKP